MCFLQEEPQGGKFATVEQAVRVIQAGCEILVAGTSLLAATGIDAPGAAPPGGQRQQSTDDSDVLEE